MPILLDKRFQYAWFSFMKALCNRYKDNPFLQRISIDDGAGSSEMYYFRDDFLEKEKIEQIKEFGFSKDNVIDLWKKNIDNVYEKISHRRTQNNTEIRNSVFFCGILWLILCGLMPQNLTKFS